MSFNIYNIESMKKKLPPEDSIKHFINLNKYEDRSYGVKTTYGNVFIVTGLEGYDSGLPGLEWPYVTTGMRGDTILVDMRRYAKGSGNRSDEFNDIFPKKSLAEFVLETAIITAAIDTGDLDVFKVDLITTIAYSVGGRISSVLMLDEVDRTVVLAAITLHLINRMYDNDIDRKIAVYHQVAPAGVIDITNISQVISDLSNSNFVDIVKSEYFDVSDRLKKATNELVHDITQQLVYGVMANQLHVGLDYYPFLLLPIIHEVYTNPMYKRTGLYAQLKSTASFTNIKELISRYEKWAKKHIHIQ